MRFLEILFKLLDVLKLNLDTSIIDFIEIDIDLFMEVINVM